MQDIAQNIAAFFRSFSQEEVEIIDVQFGENGANALCKLSDGEYQVILDNDFSVKAFYRKKPYIKDVPKLQIRSPLSLEYEDRSSEQSNIKNSSIFSSIAQLFKSNIKNLISDFKNISK
jgi:hypothetical protein